MANNESTCLKVWCWIAQFLLWGSLIYLIIALISQDEGVHGPAIVMTSITYLNYVISNACSPMCRYLCNKYGSDSIHSYMKNLFYSPPKIRWHVNCYHYRTTHHHTTDKDGKTKHNTKREKVTTHSETREFSYYTWRDLSGLFLLDSHKVLRSEKKVYIKLALNLDVQLADDLTRLDYQRQKDEFFIMNRWRDQFMDFWESKDIDGFHEYNMVRISDYKPACINYGVFLLFIFVFPFIEFYKMYVDQFCIDQSYEVKKIVSSRYNLNSQEYGQQYQSCAPMLHIFNQPQVTFNEAPQPMHNTPQLPSMEELDQAKQMGLNHKVNFNFQPTDNYTPIFTGVPSNSIGGQGMPNNQSGGMMTNFSEPVNSGGMMNNFSQPMMNNPGNVQLNINQPQQGMMMSNNFSEPMINNTGNVQLNINQPQQGMMMSNNFSEPMMNNPGNVQINLNTNQNKNDLNQKLI